MNRFEESLDTAKDVYLYQEKEQSKTTDTIMNEVFGAIDKFAAGAKKFNQSADSSPFQAAKDAAGSVQDWAANIGKTQGDVALQKNVEQAWKNMTSQQQAMYNTENEYFKQLANSDPKYKGYAGLKGFKRYQAEQRFKADPANKQYLQQAGLQPSYSGRPSTTDASAWDQWVQTKWQQMKPEMQKRYGDYANFEQIKRGEAQQGA